MKIEPVYPEPQPPKRTGAQELEALQEMAYQIDVLLSMLPDFAELTPFGHKTAKSNRDILEGMAREVNMEARARESRQ